MSESIDWARVFVLLSAKELDQKTVDETLNVLLKYEQDLKKVRSRLDEILADTSAPVTPIKASVRSTLN